MDAAEALEQVRRHHGLEVTLGERCVGGEVGAHFAHLPGEATAVFKWSDRASRADEWARVVERVGRLRDVGYPAPRYHPPYEFPGGVVLLQDAVAGSWRDDVDDDLVDVALAVNDLQAGQGSSASWSNFMATSLTEGCDGWCVHEPLRHHSRAGARLVRQVEAIGRDVPELPTGDIVHNDFHHRNVLRSGRRVSAVVDWEGSTDGDRRFDLVTFAFGLLVADTPEATRRRLWEVVRSRVPADHLVVYVAHMALRLADWRVRHHSASAADEAIAFGQRQLDLVT